MGQPFFRPPQTVCDKTIREKNCPGPFTFCEEEGREDGRD